MNAITDIRAPIAPSMQVRNLGVLHYVAGMTHWSYKPEGHTRDDVLAGGYFVSVRDMLAPGDWLFVSAADGPLILWVRATGDALAVDRVR